MTVLLVLANCHMTEEKLKTLLASCVRTSVALFYPSVSEVGEVGDNG